MIPFSGNSVALNFFFSSLRTKSEFTESQENTVKIHVLRISLCRVQYVVSLGSM